MVSCISNDDIKLIFYICSRYNSQVPKYIKKNINFTCIILIYLERLWDLLKALTFHLQKYPTMLLNKYICSGVSRISFREGGGIQNIFGKVEVFAWRETPCSAWQSHVFAIEWFGGMLPQKNF